MRRWVLAAVAATVLTPVAAQAASFPCERARTADERAICADRGLNDRDVEMAVLYRLTTSMVAMGARGTLQDEQTQWLAGRRRCGGSRACIRTSYDSRNARLHRVMDDIASRGPF